LLIYYTNDSLSIILKVEHIRIQEEGMIEEITKKAREWTSAEFDDETRKEISRLIDSGNEKELTDRFYKELDFGTGGMRGVMGAGTNRMNVYTVGKATQGLADYLLETYGDVKRRGVAIAYDSRHNSTVFAREAARVLAANGIAVYVFTELRPTPLLSFTVRHLGARAGIVLTASHNPREYNGYKMYASDGSQVVSPEDTKIVDFVNGTDITRGVKRIEYIDGVSEGLIREIGPEVEEAYLKKVAQITVNVQKGMEEQISGVKEDLSVVYTPLHGTGITLVPRALGEVRGVRVLCEPEQSRPDGDFPTTPSPNPEEKEALSRAIEYAKKENADMVIATDPDCDRMGIAVPDERGEFVTVNGNQIGCMLEYLLASSYRASGLMPENPAVVSTVVSTELAGDIARSFGADIFNVLTGFKFIAAKMRDFEQHGSHNFIFAFEESYGYLAGTFVRDKDAVIAAVLAVLLVKYATAVHGSVLKFLEFIFREYGMFLEYQRSFVLKGAEGAQKIEQLMKTFRTSPPQTIGGSRLTRINDFFTQRRLLVESGKQQPIEDMPSSNVLQFYTESGVKVSVRPSGTEPKIKFYFALKRPLEGSVEATKKKLHTQFAHVADELFSRYGLEEG
jgi:phosphoglucomutase